MSRLEDLLDRLDDERGADDPRLDAVAAIERALGVLVGHFGGLALVRGERPRVIVRPRPGGADVLIADDATPADLAAVRAGMARADRRLAVASELLGLALALPRGRLRALGERARRIVALGEELLAE